MKLWPSTEVYATHFSDVSNKDSTVFFFFLRFKIEALKFLDKNSNSGKNSNCNYSALSKHVPVSIYSLCC